MSNPPRSGAVHTAVKQHVHAIPVPGAEAARRALFDDEDLLADAEKRLRVLRGGRPSGLAQIRRGLVALQRDGQM